MTPARHAASTPSRAGHAARIIITRLAAMTATAALTLAFICTALDMLSALN